MTFLERVAATRAAEQMADMATLRLEPPHTQHLRRGRRKKRKPAPSTAEKIARQNARYRAARRALREGADDA